MTEDEARKGNRDVVTFTQDYADTAYGWALADEGHCCKLVADPSTGVLLGAHIIGPQAPTLIQPLILAMSTGVTARETAEAQYWIHPAPTELVEQARLGIAEQCESTS